MPIAAAEWYDPDPDLRNLYQGDVLDGVPLVYTPPSSWRWVLLRPLPAGPLDTARSGLPRKYVAKVEADLPTAWDRPEGELVMAAASTCRVLILSRSCNLDRKKHIQVAPVYLAQDLQGVALDSLRENDNAFSFYLPPANGFEESYADISHTATVHVSYLRRTDHLLKRLTSRATLALQEILAEYYAKPFGSNITDPVPQSTSYRCANCFFTNQPSPTATELPAGGQFPTCPTCGDRALWVKVPRSTAQTGV